jgi:hypothetical protein
MGPPDQAATFSVVERGLQLAGAESTGDVEQRACGVGTGNELAWLDVSRTEVECSMNDPGHGTG